jgi:hypothetical protein
MFVEAIAVEDFLLTTEIVEGIAIKDVGLGIMVVIKGFCVGAPLVWSVINTEPEVFGSWVIRLGRICTCPEELRVVITKTDGITLEVLRD